MTPLEVARRLAQRICAAAQWRNDRCTWLDQHRPLDADLYAGTSGIADFLAHVAIATGDEAALRTAAGAVRHALDRVAARPVARNGFQCGDLGTLWAAATVGTRGDDAALVERACALVSDVRRRLPPPGAAGFDLLGGSAGDLLAMLGLARWLGTPAVHDARRIGTLLSAGARAMPYGVAWPEVVRDGADASPSPTAAPDAAPRDGEPAPAHHVGMAHGASGIACALAELALVTGESGHADGRFGDTVRSSDATRSSDTTRSGDDAEFGDTATAALAFERAWFDAGTCSWRDPRTRRPTSTSWCRGSAGIGQARLRCLRLARARPGRPQVRRLEADAGAALASVHTTLAGVLSPGLTPHHRETGDLSVCHGLMGAVDLLVHAADVLGVEAHRAAAERVLDHGLRRAAAEDGWPYGTVDRSASMGLFLGLAGIGTVCLRVALPGRVPPVGLPLAAYSTS